MKDLEKIIEKLEKKKKDKDELEAGFQVKVDNTNIEIVKSVDASPEWRIIIGRDNLWVKIPLDEWERLTGAIADLLKV